MTVCQSWSSIIKNTTLVQDIRITEDANLESLIHSIEAQKLPGHQVKILTVRNLRSSAQRFRQLASYFPHLAELSWPIALAYDPVPLSEEERVTFKQWHFSLEKLECFTEFSFFPEILQQATFEKLTELHLHVGPDESPYQLFVSLRAAPVLSILKLDIPQLSIEDIETLHENTPALTSLELEDTVFTEDSVLPTTIVPVLAFKSLYITEQCILNNGEVWMPYFAQKYKRLERFVVACPLGNAPVFGNILLIPHNATTTINQSLCELLYGFGPQLKSFRISRSPLNKHILNVMDEVGLQLEELHLGDSHGRKDLIHAFEESNQWKSVETLSVINYPLIQSPKKNFKVKKLTIKNFMRRDNSLYLDRILEQYPNLKELVCNCSRIKLDSDDLGIFPLRRLRLQAHLLDDSLFEYLSRCTPMLYNVSIHCLFHYEEGEAFSLNLQLPQHRLQKFSFNTHLKDFDVKVTTEGVVKCYRVTSDEGFTSVVTPLEDESMLDVDRLVVMACKNATYLRVKYLDLK
ncbi:hypothetical protein K501DRAFT_282948 [Backusella circina FSU 941]|nr:hypothetical protein K501DRAFT_282948 [Backusella circina FSU 941]